MVGGRPTGGIAEVEHLSVLIADDDAPFRAQSGGRSRRTGWSSSSKRPTLPPRSAPSPACSPTSASSRSSCPVDGLTAIGRIVKASPETLVIVLSRSDHPEDVVTAFTRGASGYLLKGLSDERLASHLGRAHNGEPALSRSLVPHLVDEIRRGSVRRLVLPGGPVTLTARESEVGELLREGQSTAEIADRLGVSPVTVRRHVGLLLHKLGAESREAAIELLRAAATLRPKPLERCDLPARSRV